MSYDAPPPPPPPPGYGSGYGDQPAAAGTNTKAVWSLVLGILSLFCCGVVTGVIAIVLGRMAQNEIAASGGYQGGAGMAKAGFVLGIIGAVLSVLGLVLYASGSFHYPGLPNR
jgi:Domain of unknown function (DUF4190)